MQVILRKEKKWFIMDREILENPEVCRTILRQEENVPEEAESERPLAQLILHGWDWEAVA